MKNMVKLFGFIVFVAIIGFSITACGSNGGGGASGGSSGTNLSGTRWITMGGLGEVSFSGSNFTIKVFGLFAQSGTYTITGNIITCTTTSLGPGAKEESKVGDKHIFQVIDEDTLYSKESSEDYYWTKVK